MYKELSYLTPEGYTVFTAQYHKNRGTCCKSACLHCPFGYTLKKHGLQFREVTEADTSVIESILEANSLNLEWKSFAPENIRLIVIKDTVCGFFLKNHIVIKHLILLPKFNDQSLSREMVESYFFV
jgi:hypothetical protein